MCSTKGFLFSATTTTRHTFHPQRCWWPSCRRRRHNDSCTGGPIWGNSGVRPFTYGVEDIITGKRKELGVARVGPYADEPLASTAELREVFTTLKN